MNEYKPSIKRLAAMASARPSLMSSLMLLYREQEGMDDKQLADYLECDVDALPRLALCRRPRQAPDFRGDIEAIAVHSGSDPSRLARLVRSAAMVEAMQGAPERADTSSLLMAARDREDLGDTDVEAPGSNGDSKGSPDDSC